jgi:hypothetical protein
MSTGKNFDIPPKTVIFLLFLKNSVAAANSQSAKTDVLKEQ